MTNLKYQNYLQLVKPGYINLSPKDVPIISNDCAKTKLVLTSLTNKKYGKKVSKGANIRNRYNPVSHPTQDTNRKVTKLQLDTTIESQEVSPFPAGEKFHMPYF